MKRYVKIKDGRIIDTFDYVCYLEKGGFMPFEEWFAFVVGNAEILYDSNSIKDLCDEFIWEPCDAFMSPNLTYITTLATQDYVEKDGVVKLTQDVDGTIYGANWVLGKGLVYVAKFNKDRILELIKQNGGKPIC